jgi:hypothetical protein
MLAGDIISRELRRRGGSFTFDLDAPPIALEEAAQGGTDSGNVAEFLAYDIPFRTEPATGLIFPPEVGDG